MLVVFVVLEVVVVVVFVFVLVVAVVVVKIVMIVKFEFVRTLLPSIRLHIHMFRLACIRLAQSTA